MPLTKSRGGHHDRRQGRTARGLLESLWLRHPSDYRKHRFPPNFRAMRRSDIVEGCESGREDVMGGAQVRRFGPVAALVVIFVVGLLTAAPQAGADAGPAALPTVLSPPER